MAAGGRLPHGDAQAEPGLLPGYGQVRHQPQPRGGGGVMEECGGEADQGSSADLREERLRRTSQVRLRGPDKSQVWHPDPDPPAASQ